MSATVITKAKIAQQNSKYIFLFIVITIYISSLIIFPKSVSSGIKSGINCCLDVLIPSMFPFMVVAAVVTVSGLDEKFKFIFAKPAKFLFYLPPCTVPAIIISLFGGYPIGAYCIKSLYKSGAINEEQMNRMMCFCVNFGPAFIISALGQILLSNYNLGIILFLIQVFSSVLIAVIMGIIARIKKADFYYKKAQLKNKNFSFSQILIKACDSASKSLLGVCSLVTLFFGIISVLNDLGLINFISCLLLRKINIPQYISNTLVLSTIEMTQSCIMGAKNSATPYPTYSWIIGFGGICAHTQIISQLRDCPFKYSKFLIMRIINGLFTCAVTALVIKNPKKILPVSAQLTMNQAAEISKASPTHLGSIILLIFCVLFTFNVHSLAYENNNK